MFVINNNNNREHLMNERTVPLRQSRDVVSDSSSGFTLEPSEGGKRDRERKRGFC